MPQQLVKKGANGRYSNVMPKSWIEAIKDKNTGKTLVEILQGFNMYFLSYNGNTSATRCLVPTMLRKKGLWITYVKYDGNVYTEWYAADEIDDTSWGDSSNWRVGNNTLVGDITISSNGNWVINGTETEFKAVGEKGNTPLVRFGSSNKFQVSYNNGAEWLDISDSITNNLRIKKYIGINESLPTSGVEEGAIYMKGPYYAEDDTLNDNPIYRMWVYAWKGNTLAWQDNGEFTSISAGVVQETGDSETEVMSQKAVSKRLSDVDARINAFEKDVYSVKYKTLVSTSNSYSYTIPITFKKEDNIIFSMTSDNMKSDAYLGVTYNGETKNLYLNTIYNLEIISDNSTISVWVPASQAVSDGDLVISIESSNSTSNRINKVEDKLDNTVLPVIEESPEYAYVIKDINNNILLGITKDGKVVYPKQEVVNIDSTVKNTSLFKCDKEIKFTSVATEMRNFGEAETILKWQQDTWKDGIYRLGLYRLSWGNYEQMMAYADKYGITKEQLLITNFPTLEDFKKDEGGNYTTEITDEYKNMVVDFIRRHNIVYYEMGNEQSLVYGGGNNDKVYYPGVTDEQVFEGWRQLYKLIKTNFPSIQVLTGAFHWARPALLMKWLEYKYDDGTRAWDYFDIYSFHYYSYDLYAENIVTDIVALQELFQSYSTDYNSKLLDKKVWITEIGPGSNEVKGNQAKRLAKINIMSLALGVERLIIYKLFNQVGTEGSEHAIITSWNINKEEGTITDIEGEGYYANLFFKDICSYGSTRPSLIINDGIYYSHWISPKYGNVFVVWAKYPDNIILEYNHSLGNTVVFDVMGNKINNLGNRLIVNDSPLFIVGLTDIKFNKL